MKFIGALSLILLCVACSPAKEQPKPKLHQGANIQNTHTPEGSIQSNHNDDGVKLAKTTNSSLSTTTHQNLNTSLEHQQAINIESEIDTDAENLVEINTHTSGGLSYVNKQPNDTVPEQTTVNGQLNPSHSSTKQVYSDDLGAVLIGEYEGNLPCKSCKFIQVLLQLDVDGTAKKTTRYVIDGEPSNTNNSVVERGYYTQKGGVISIHFSSKNKQESYQIEGSNLMLLTEDQSEVMDITASDYVLAKR